MFPRLLLICSIFLLLALAGCATESSAPPQAPGESPPTAVPEAGSSDAAAPPRRMGMGPGSGMMARHHAQIPEAYAGLANPVPAGEESLARGAEIYNQYCASCHGDGGMGDGPAGAQLDPLPAPIAHTTRMLGDDYLFWRISEGGAHEPFSSAMPRWQDVLDDADRWDVINYIRALGSGQVMPGRGPRSGATFDPQIEAQRHAQMAADGVAQGVLTQEEADTFLAVHIEMDRLMAEDMPGMMGGMDSMQQQMLDQLTAGGVITAQEAATFKDAHEKLLAAGLMQ